MHYFYSCASNFSLCNALSTNSSRRVYIMHVKTLLFNIKIENYNFSAKLGNYSLFG